MVYTQNEISGDSYTHHSWSHSVVPVHWPLWRRGMIPCSRPKSAAKTHLVLVFETFEGFRSFRISPLVDDSTGQCLPSKGSSGSAAITTTPTSRRMVLTLVLGLEVCVVAMSVWMNRLKRWEWKASPTILNSKFLDFPELIVNIVMIVVNCCERQGLRHAKVAVSFSHVFSTWTQPAEIRKFRSCMKLQESTKNIQGPSDPVLQHQLGSLTPICSSHILEVIVAFLASASGSDSNPSQLWTVALSMSITVPNNINIYQQTATILPGNPPKSPVRERQPIGNQSSHPRVHPKCPGKLHTVQQAVPGTFPKKAVVTQLKCLFFLWYGKNAGVAHNHHQKTDLCSTEKPVLEAETDVWPQL